MANIVRVAVHVPKMVPRHPKSNFHNAVIFFGPSMVKEPEGEVFVPERSPTQQSTIVVSRSQQKNLQNMFIVITAHTILQYLLYNE